MTFTIFTEVKGRGKYAWLRVTAEVVFQAPAQAAEDHEPHAPTTTVLAKGQYYPKEQSARYWSPEALQAERETGESPRSAPLYNLSLDALQAHLKEATDQWLSR